MLTLGYRQSSSELCAVVTQINTLLEGYYPNSPEEFDQTLVDVLQSESLMMEMEELLQELMIKHQLQD